METPDLITLLEPILEQSPIAITVADATGRLTLFNKAAESLTGYAREEVLGQHVARFYGSEAELAELWKQVSAAGKLEDYETTLVCKGGDTRPVSIVITALHDASGNPVGTLGISMDLTERHRLQHELRRAKQQAEFYNDLMCHDVRNFAQTAAGALEMVLGGDAGDLTDDQSRLLRMCYRQTRRTWDLIDQVTTLATMESEGAGELAPARLDRTLRDAARAVGEAFEERGPVLAFDELPEAEVRASPLLFALFYNLIGNAVIHNSGENPHVWISAHPLVTGDGAHLWQVRVDDDGPGIDDARKPLIFERFRRGDPRGSGIGLSWVQSLTESYGGRVWVEDRIVGRPSQGARFVVELRRAEGEVAS